MLGLVGGGVFVPRTSIAAHGQVPHVRGHASSADRSPSVFFSLQRTSVPSGLTFCPTYAQSFGEQSPYETA